MYEEARKLYTEEINAAVRGAKAAGADEILVMDHHGAGKGWSFNSLIPELLDPACEYVVQSSWTEYTDFLEEGCDACLLIAMHARAGTTDGVMNHTVSGQAWRNLWFNGTLVGETGINAALCGQWGCPGRARDRGRRHLPRGDRAARGRPDHRRRQDGPRPLQRAPDPAHARARADRGGRAQGALRRPEGGRAVRPGPPVRDPGRDHDHRPDRGVPAQGRRSRSRSRSPSSRARTTGGPPGRGSTSSYSSHMGIRDLLRKIPGIGSLDRGDHTQSDRPAGREHRRDDGRLLARHRHRPVGRRAAARFRRTTSSRTTRAGPENSPVERFHCYCESTDGVPSSREIELLVLLRGPESLISSPKPRSRRTCPNESFHALGVSAEVSTGARRPRHRHALSRSSRSSSPPRSRGGDILAKSPTGSGKTLAFGVPIVDRISRRRRRAGRADPRSDARARRPGHRGADADRQVQGAARRGRLRRHARCRSRRSGSRAPTSSSPRPGRLFDLIERRLVKLDQVERPRPRRGRPDARHGLQAAGRPDRQAPADRERQTMLFSATLDGEVGELARAYTREPGRFEAQPPEGAGSRRRPTTGSSRSRQDGKVDALIEELEGERGLALVFVRTKRGADRLAAKLDAPRRARPGAARRHDAERARARARPLPLGQGRRPSSPRTWPPAASTSSTSRTWSTSIRPRTTRATSTAIGRTGRAGRDGSGVTLVTPDQQADVSRVAVRLGHREQFEREGMSVARPKLLYTSRRGRRSRW